MPFPVAPAIPAVPFPGRRGIAGVIGVIPSKVGADGGAGPTLTTTRYVRKSGSDSNGGTSSSDAWLTVNKALTTASPGTIIYIGAGVYRELQSVTITPTAALPVVVIGDVTGQFTGDAGMVQITAYLTNDKTVPSGTLLNLNGKSNLTFQNIMFVGGTATLVTASTATSQNITFRDCALATGATFSNQLFAATCAYGMPFNWVIDRCDLFIGGIATQSIVFTLTTGAGSDYDANVLISNCRIIGGQAGSNGAVQVTASGALAGRGGGVRIKNCTALVGSAFLRVASANVSVQIPCVVTGCLVGCGGTAGLSATTSGQIIEDYNLIASAALTNVTNGAHSIIGGSYAPLFHFGQERIWGGNSRPFGEPMSGSPLTAFGAPDTAAGLLDIRRGPRPSTFSKWDVGAYQRGNNFSPELNTVLTGINAISCVGEGFQDYDLTVAAGVQTISVWCYYDSSYVGPMPSLMIVNGGQVNVGDSAVGALSTSLNQFAQLSIVINPTAAGIVTVRLISRDVSAAGKVVFDSLTVA